MKKTSVLFVALMLAGMAVAGCGSAKAPGAETTPAITTAPTTETPAITTAPITDTPEITDKGAAALSPYFPTDYVTLPPESKVIDVFNDFEDMEYDMYCWETTVLELPMTKTEAIEYFTPELNKQEVNHFEVSKDMSDYIPWQIEEDYPDVTNYVEIYASYAYGSDGVNVAIIKVQLFTKDDNETIVVAWIAVEYSRNPVATPPPSGG